MNEACKVCLMTGVLERDSHYGEDQLVCTACGAVVDSENLVSDEPVSSTPGSTFHPNSSSVVLNGANVPIHMRSVAVQNSLPKAAKDGLATIKRLASIYKLNVTMTTRTNNLYRQALKNFVFLRSAQKKKTILAACCVYVVLRECNHPVTISSLCQHISVSQFEFRPIYDKFAQVSGIRVTTTSIEDAIPITLNNIVCEEKQQLFQLTAKLIRVAKDLWITSGRPSEPLIYAAAFLAWKSMNARHVKSTFPHFCKMTNLSFTKAGIARVSEISSMLVKLANQLPWIKPQQITKRNVTLHLDSILKYATSLQLSVQAKISRDTQHSSQLEIIQKQEDIDAYKTYRFSFKRVGLADRESEEEAKAAHTEYLFGSTSVTQDEDIPDAEIDKYIRTETEVEALQCIKQW